MKNEALERLWRMLNIADIEGGGATKEQVSSWFALLGEGLPLAEEDEEDRASTEDSYYESGREEGHAEGYLDGFLEGYEHGWDDRGSERDYDPHWHI